MAKKQNKSIKRIPASKLFILSPTETDAGVEWLHSLPEDVFRDEILEHLFRSMQKEKVLAWYKNIHGRNDKGVDFLLVFNSELGQRIIGIQAKSKTLTRTGEAGTISSLQVKQECEAAMKHEFDVQKSKSRLDNIELWCSAHITEDGEKEFNAAGDSVKVQVKRASHIFTLIEKFSSDLLKKIPQCALTNYVRDKKNPASKRIKLLGRELHPKKHFLEPIFSTSEYGSSASVDTKSAAIQKRRASIHLADIVFNHEHALILAPELSGKTYLLEHVACLIAESNSIPVFLDNQTLAGGKVHSVYSLISNTLGFCSAGDIEQLAQTVRIFLLVDNIDTLSDETRKLLFSLDANKIKVFSTARNSPLLQSLKGVFYMAGVNLGCITKFLRALDSGVGEDKAFLDRAHSFIGRTLTTSGLPSTPFTISMMLAECQNSTQKFSTPTMGRLIERFVEMQIGSHADNTNRVDFETKSEFLMQLGGHKTLEFKVGYLKREIAKFIEDSAHPHTVEDFIADLSHSGVFTLEKETLKWSHPVLKQYYWVKNLVGKRKLEPVLKKLQKELNLTLASLTGSQLKNAGDSIDILIKDLNKIKLPPTDTVLDIVNEGSIFDVLISDEDEEKWLASLEQDGLDLGADSTKKHPIAQLAESGLKNHSEFTEPSEEMVTKEKPETVLDPQKRAELQKKIEPLIAQMAECKLHIAFNLAALLINARGTKTPKKQEAVIKIISATQFLGKWFQDIIELFFSDKLKIKHDMVGARMFSQMTILDRMIGDPFLISVFKRLLPKAKTDEEVLMYLDLLLCCGEDDYETIIHKVSSVKSPELVAAFYLRVTVLYFFRFHRDKDRNALRILLKGIRKNCKIVSLKPIAV